ncbi:hypothetical protein SAMN03159339_5347 [Variovorax sp. 770b2]|nr:hypothetical protein SAMN03159339_5347 [Variovorax sp. 770b2]
MEPWETLLELKSAQKIADIVDRAIKEIWSRMGRKPPALHMQGTTSYVMSTTRSE